MEDLLKAKEEEIAQLLKMKDRFATMIKTLKQENQDLKAKLDAGGDQETGAGSNSEIAKKLEDAQKEIADLKQQLATSVGKKKDSEEFNDELEKDLPVAELLKQVKNGMFKLGQQNFSIEQKVDELLEKIADSVPISGSTPAVSQNRSNVPVAATPSKPYYSPGLDASNAVAAPEPKKEKEELHVRKPSDLLKKAPDRELDGSITENTPQSASGMMAPMVEFGKKDPALEFHDEIQTISKKPAAPEPAAESPNKPALSSSQAPSHAIKTIPYPDDGVLICPHCGAQNFQEMENRAKIISFVPVKRYGKKYYCKQCRGQWDYLAH